MPESLRPAHDHLPLRPAMVGQIPLHPGPRSAIPKVVGILAIVFASLGGLMSFVPLGSIEEEMAKHSLRWADLGSFATWTFISLAVSLAISGIHLTAGILAVLYRRPAPLFMTIYGALALAFIGVDIAVSSYLFDQLGHGGADDLVGGRIGLGLMAFPWPVVAIVLMNLPSARRACAPR